MPWSMPEESRLSPPSAGRAPPSTSSMFLLFAPIRSLPQKRVAQAYAQPGLQSRSFRTYISSVVMRISDRTGLRFPLGRPDRRVHVRVIVMSDMEGVAGITKWEQVSAGDPMFPEGRRLYTEELNAAARGAF